MPAFWCIYLILFLILGRYDLVFSTYMTEHRIALFTAWGQHIALLPGALITCWCGFAAARREQGIRKYTLYLAAVTASLIGGWQMGNALGEHAVLFSGLLAALMCFMMHYAAGRSDFPADAESDVIYIGILTAVLSTSVTTVLKFVWARPRFWALGMDGRIFQPWYRISGPALITDADKSFPSGHTTSSSAILWITLLPSLYPRLKKREGILRAAVPVWIVLTALARIMAGMHYITDTMAGFAVTLSIFLILKKKLFSENNQNDGTS